jgi:hypothetical protein
MIFHRHETSKARCRFAARLEAARAAIPGGRDARLVRWPIEAATGCSVDLDILAE